MNLEIVVCYILVSNPQCMEATLCICSTLSKWQGSTCTRQLGCGSQPSWLNTVMSSAPCCNCFGFLIFCPEIHACPGVAAFPYKSVVSPLHSFRSNFPQAGVVILLRSTIKHWEVLCSKVGVLRHKDINWKITLFVNLCFEAEAKCWVRITAGGEARARNHYCSSVKFKPASLRFVYLVLQRLKGTSQLKTLKSHYLMEGRQAVKTLLFNRDSDKILIQIIWLGDSQLRWFYSYFVLNTFCIFKIMHKVYSAWLISETLMKQTCWHKITDHIHTVELSISEHELQTSIVSILEE